MRTTAAFLILAAAVSAMGAASPAFAASEGAQASPLGPHAPPVDIVGTSIFFGALVAIVLLAQVFATRRERIRQETLRAMVDRGMEIPPGLIGDRARRTSDLRNGLVLVGAGVGVSLAFALVHLNGQSASELWSIGLVPMLMGGGYLVAWRVQARNTSDRP
jgi:hypothetical protein